MQPGEKSSENGIWKKKKRSHVVMIME